jgi:hypothetical protein
MLDVVTEINQDEETQSFVEEVRATGNGKDQNLKTIDGKQELKRKMPIHYDM